MINATLEHLPVSPYQNMILHIQSDLLYKRHKVKLSQFYLFLSVDLKKKLNLQHLMQKTKMLQDNQSDTGKMLLAPMRAPGRDTKPRD